MSFDHQPASQPTPDQLRRATDRGRTPDKVPVLDPASQPTSDQLRGAIDRGRTRDNIPALDPAAAPLDTDSEAAGTPASREAIEAAMREEIRGRPTDGEGNGMMPLAVGVIGAPLAFAGLGVLLWVFLG
jgi:hypothetical protein